MTERQRRKAERALCRARKVRRQLRLAPDATIYGEGEGQAGGEDIKRNQDDRNIEASATEGAARNTSNIENK